MAKGKRSKSIAGAAEAATEAQLQEQATEARMDAVAAAPEMQQAEPVAPANAEEKPKPQYGYGGEIVAIPGGKAHLRDFGNRGGIDVILELPEGEKPAPGVTEPLKEHRRGHTNYQYKGKGHWHKRLTGSGLNPTDERSDAYDRFREAVKREKEAKDGQGEDGHSR